jgi:hypothetical protein
MLCFSIISIDLGRFHYKVVADPSAHFRDPAVNKASDEVRNRPVGQCRRLFNAPRDPAPAVPSVDAR